jgi:hypothetical protein
VTGNPEKAGQRTEMNSAANTLALRATLRLNVRFAQGFELFARSTGFLFLSQPFLLGKEMRFVFAQCDVYHDFYSTATFTKKKNAAGRLDVRPRQHQSPESTISRSIAVPSPATRVKLVPLAGLTWWESAISFTLKGFIPMPFTAP